VKDLPFGIWFAARTEAIFGALYLIGGAVLFNTADDLSGTPTLLGSAGEGVLAMMGLLLVAIGVLDLVAAVSLTRPSGAGFAGVMACSAASAAVSAYLLTLGLTMGAMNLLLNIGVPVYLMRWDVRQEYIPR